MKTRFAIIAFVVLVLTGTVHAQPELQLLPGDAAISAAAGNQTAPAIARGGDLFLAVWSDQRANPTSAYEYETSNDIYGVRLDAAGNLLDQVPIGIFTGKSSQNNPKVVWNGVNWLVVFESYDLGGTGYYQKSLAAVRVSPAGHVLELEPIKLYGLTPLAAGYWAVASEGVNWIVVNEGGSTSGDIAAVRVSPDGTLLDPPTRTLVEATYYTRSNLKLAFADGVFLLTFNDQYVNGTFDTKAVRFDSNLSLLDSAPIALLPTPLSDLAANGSGFYIVWHRQEPDFSVKVAGSRVSTVGAKLDGNGVNLSGTRRPYAYATTAVVWDGITWRVSWGEDNATTYLARVTSAGRLRFPGSVAVPGIQTGPIAGNGVGGVQLVWTELSNSNNDVFSANIAANNVVGPKRSLSLGAPRQLRPDIATSGNGSMLVYLSSTAAQNRVLAQPLDASGVALTTGPIELDAGDFRTGPSYPNVAWNGSLYLVAWGNANGIVAQRLLPDGTKVDPSPFVVMSAANSAFGSADVAALGNDFLVAGRKIGINIQYIFPVVARVRGSDGAVLDPAPLVLGNSYVPRIPAVVVLGGRWLVAWHRNATHDDSFAVTMGAFVNSSGAQTTEFQIHGGFSTAGGNGIFELALASSGDIALMVQSQEFTSGVETDLLGRFVEADGTVRPVLGLTPWSGNQYKPRAAWDGTNFVIVFQDQKNRLATSTLDQLDARSDVFAMRISPTGSIIDSQGFVISASEVGETDPNITALHGVSLLVGSKVLNDADFGNYRVVHGELDNSVNQKPVASAVAIPDSGDVPLAVSFSSDGSRDLDGTVVSYSWDFGDGATSTLPEPTHNYKTAGPYLVTLTVSDNVGATTMQTIRVKATDPNHPPVAVAGANKTSSDAPLDVIFYSDGSYDPDSFVGNIHWEFSDGSESWGSPAFHTFHVPGVYTATMTVFDSRGGTGSADVCIIAFGFATMLADCLGGPDMPYGTGCDVLDLDRDNDVDLFDVRLSRLAITCDLAPKRERSLGFRPGP